MGEDPRRQGHISILQAGELGRGPKGVFLETPLKHTPPPIRLRLFTPADAEEAFTMYSDPDVMRFLGNGATIPSIEDLRERLFQRDQKLREGESPRIWAVIDPESGSLIGGAIYGPIPHSEAYAGEPEEWEIGWHLAKAWWGKGYGTAIALAMIEKAREEGRAVVAIAYPENTASLRIMQKVGMTHQGTTDRFYNLGGLVLYTLDTASP
jgi:[ribosomal protein S5]-alanine N-acetyltransferase